MKYSLIITAWKEPETVEKNLTNILTRNSGNLLQEMEIILVCPDEETMNAAINVINKFGFDKFIYIKDDATGKPDALNKAFDTADGEIIICTDGDVLLAANALPNLVKRFENKEIGGISGRPVSADSKKTLFGYWGNLLADAAHQKRTREAALKRNYYMSGYLLAFKKVEGLKIPSDTLVDDAWLTTFISNRNQKIAYAPDALVLVKYPKNFKDWLKQKRRSAGGYSQLKKSGMSLSNSGSRNFIEELKYIFFPIGYSRNLKEFFFSLLLYPARLFLWILILLDSFTGKHKNNRLWVRVESTKV